MKKNFFIVAAALFSTATQAQDTTNLLNEVTVTAAKFVKKQIETGKVITVISNQEIAQSGSKTLSEILQTQAGIVVQGANNNFGTNQTVSIRGASAGNVLILIDGVPAYDPSVITNYFDLNFITTNNIERIEILKGGQSTLYGSDAVAGAINIITKKATSNKFDLHAGISAGSFNTFQQQIGISGKHKFSYILNYHHLNGDGFSAANDKVGNKSFEKDGFNQHAVNGTLGFKLSNNTSLKLFTSYSYYKNALDASAFTDEKDYTGKNNNVQSGFGIVHQQPKTKGTLYFNYAFNYSERNYKDDSVYKVPGGFVNYSTSNYIGRSHFAELYDSWKWSKWEFLLGMDYRLNNTIQDYFSTGPFGDYATNFPTKKISQASPYTSLVYKATKGFIIEAGARLNIHSAYGSNASFTLNPSYLVNKNVKLFTNIYSAYKTPTLYQLYEVNYGNEDLKPESGIITEAGLQLMNKDGFTSRLTGFYRNTKNKIEFIITNPVFFTSQYQNVSKQTNFGGEIELNYKKDAVSLSANYTYTDGKTTSTYDGTGMPIGKDTAYNNLYRIPKHAINVSLGYNFSSKFYVSAAARIVSDRTEFVYGATPATLDKYSVLDIYAHYKFTKFKLFVNANNVLDKTYFDVLGYNSKKRNLMVGLNFVL